jgi:spermidine synthase
VRSFLAVYPQGWAMLATNSLETPVLGLVARRDGGRFAPGAVRERIRSVALPQPPAEFGLGDEFAVLGSFIAGPAALARFAGNAAFNTDDHPVVAYRAPRITYAPDSLPRDRLLALLSDVDLSPDELVDGAADGVSPARLSNYWQARNRFLAIGRDVQPTADVRRMLAQVGAPLLSLLQASPEFRPAYEPLLRMAHALTDVDPTAGCRLLAQLEATQANRPEADRFAAPERPPACADVAGAAAGPGR